MQNNYYDPIVFAELISYIAISICHIIIIARTVIPTTYLQVPGICTENDYLWDYYNIHGNKLLIKLMISINYLLFITFTQHNNNNK